ncbi:tetratricopeptide repeat protein [Saccharothrix syringae]|uniref:Tetratricopeptide repeat protein n=1 Tax=Saccharothrix syringae TaxID=103733 RepID=A0A5Q0H5S1_SACSY|nr:tetratricopeptide repeat protein [Saccharothrix syringae]
MSQSAWAYSGGKVQQAGRDLYNFQLPEGRGAGVVSVTPPRARLPGHLRGRDALSADLAGLLDDPPGRLVVLHGAGGYGKSTLALWLACHADDRGVPVWWVSAHHGQALADGLREVALRSGADLGEVEMAWANRGSAPDLLWRVLNARDGRWLLVVDNADDVRSLAGGGRVADGTGWLRHPAPGGGLVVVTSRQGNPSAWPRGSDLRGLAPLDVPAAGRVLIDLAGPGAGGAPDAERLGDRLGGLPLALRLAGSYLAMSDDVLRVPGTTAPRTFTDYLAALDERPALLDAPPGDHDDERDERELITRTWELSLDLLASRGHDLARPLLRLLSCFGPAPIPVDLLDAALLATVPMWASITPDALARLLRALLDLGLVDRGDQAVGLHRLIRETNRRHVGAEPGAEQHAAALARLVDAASGLSLNSANWSRWSALATHAEAALDLCRAHLDRVPADAVRCAIGAARAAILFRRAVGDLDQAAADSRVVVEVLEEVQGEHHPDTLAAKVDLVTVRGHRGSPARAEAELLELLELQRRVLGEGHLETLRTGQALAGRIADQRHWSRAERVYRETREVALREHGPDDESALACWQGIAQTLFFQGRLDEAEAEYREALGAFRRVLGAEHNGTFVVWQGYADVLAAKGKAAAAVREFRPMLRAGERMWGERGETTLAVRSGLAVALRRSGRCAEAADHYRAILDLGLPVYGEAHPGMLVCRCNLAGALVELGDVDQGRSELAKALAVQRRVCGETHPDTLQTVFELAYLDLADRGDPGGRQGMRDFLAAARPVLGGGHPLVRAAEEVLSRPLPPHRSRPPSRHERRRRRPRGGG